MKILSFSKWPVLGACLLSLFGCEGGGATGGSTGSGGSMGGNGASSSCPALEYLFSPRSLREPGNTSRSLIRPVVADEANVYFLESDKIYRVPVGGGEPAQIATVDAATQRLWIYKGQLLMATLGRLELMPLEGGARTMVVQAPTTFLINDDSELSGDLLFKTESSFTDPNYNGIMKVDLANRTATFLSTGSQDVRGVALAGDRFLVGLATGNSVTLPVKLHTMSLDGQALTPMFPDMSLWPRIGDDAYVLLAGNMSPTAMGQKELYRMPVAGGELDVVPDPPLFESVALAAAGVVSHQINHLVSVETRAQVWYLPWRAAPIRVGCASILNSGGIQAIGAFGQAAYVSVRLPDETVTVARINLP